MERGQCPTAVRACLLHHISQAGPNRILRVLVSTNRDRAGLIGAIGHELHHAADALSNLKVRTATDMLYHFRRPGSSLTGPVGDGRLETKEAVKAGPQIEHELKSGRRPTEY